MSKLDLDFYLEEDVVALSQKVLGCLLSTYIDGVLTSGYIIESEAYQGPQDQASHAYQMRRTARNEVMYHQGGISYVYLCYGIHPLFNIVTNVEGIPHAILIRALLPKEGIETMHMRRKCSVLQKLTQGPGNVTKALGIDLSFNGASLLGNQIWLSQTDRLDYPIVAGPRIGIDYAGEDAKLPWRFRYQL